MERLTSTQRNWIIGALLVAAVVILGTIGWSFYSRGNLGRQGVRFETGFGLGGPEVLGDNPGHGCAPCGAKGTVHSSGLVRPYDADIDEESSWKASKGPSGTPFSGAY